MEGLLGRWQHPCLWLAIAIGWAVVSPCLAQFDTEDPSGDLGGLLGDPLGGGAPISVSAQFTAPTAGRPGELVVTATMPAGWHVYSVTQPKGGPIATTIRVDPSADYRLAGPFVASTAPQKKIEPLFGNLSVETHSGTVTWRAPLELRGGADPAGLAIRGVVNAQPCDASSCLPPQDFPFTATLGPGVSAAAVPAGSPAGRGLAVTLGLALLGGLILNLMPCVLPVISLKLLSFLQQGGESRGRVFVLNLYYSAGLLAVFLVLATLAVSAEMAWGEQFTLPWFKVALTALVFVMALAFLGVWEIPIPGFVGSSQAGALQSREGVEGAFLKGVFATILATPCSGPLLGPLFGSLLGQPPLVVYLVFGAIGLGMASPYLLIGAFPRLIVFLPKPGAWMETFKQVMAFLLLGTVVYLFMTMSPLYFVPTLALLVGLWFACWWIGRTPLAASDAAKWTARLGGLATAALVGTFAFTVLLAEHQIPWEPFSPEALAKARAEGKTVMVDFTADWCLTCKTNLHMAIETDAVRELIQENNVVPLLADWTDRSEVIKKALNELGYNSIPVLAVWPAGAPDDHAIILVDLLSQRQVLEALRRAGPSQTPPIVPAFPRQAGRGAVY